VHYHLWDLLLDALRMPAACCSMSEAPIPSPARHLIAASIISDFLRGNIEPLSVNCRPL